MSSSNRRARWRRVRSRLVPPITVALLWLVSALGWRAAQRLGALLGRLAWPLARRDRRRTLEHLAIAYPDMAESARRRLGRACFAHFGTTLFECLYLMGVEWAAAQRHVRVEGWETIESLRAAGRQILILTGHCGNWELLAATISCRGLPLAVVARQGQDARLDCLLVGLRERFGTTTIARGTAGAARDLLRALRGGGALGMLIDQDTQVEGAWVPFFGRPAFTPLGAAQIGARRGVAVVPSFIERRDDGSHLATFHPPLELPDDAVLATALMTRTIEEQVRRRPEQWVWMHRRWRTQPPAATAE